MDSWVTTFLNSTSCGVGMKSGLTISLSLYFFLSDFLDFVGGSEVEGFFSTKGGLLVDDA